MITSKPAISIGDKSYCAGLIDGEGYFYIVKGSVKKSKVYMKSGMKIAMIDRSGILSITKDLWGGWGKEKKARSIKHRNTMEWIIEGKNLEKLIQDILPFLRGKKQQAEIVLEFRRFVSKNNMVTENIENYRNHLANGLKGLHHSIPFDIDPKLREKALYDQKNIKWHITEEHRRKLSESHKGINVENMFQKGHVPWTKGRKLSEEHKRKIGVANSIALKGHTPWNKKVLV